MASSAEELVEGLSDLLKSVGFSTSFLDNDEVIARGLKEAYWKMVSRGIINPLSLENKIFRDNLVFVLEKKE